MTMTNGSGRGPRRVIIESPLAGDFDRNIRYAQLCVLDSLNRDEAPFASHLLYTQVLDDEVPGAREMGILAGLAWAGQADLCAIYIDLGFSDGMRRGRRAALGARVPIEHRHLSLELLDRLGESPYSWATRKK